jgi:hypothetical protein
MSLGGSTNKQPTATNTTQASEPWGPSQYTLKKGITGANKLYNANTGYKPWDKPVLAKMNPTLTGAYANQMGLAQQPVENLAGANSAVGGIIANGGWTPETRSFATESGLNAGQTQAAGDYRKIIDAQGYTEDPRFQQMLDTNANRAINGAATRFGGGRYGSSGIGQGVGTAVAEANNAAMYQSNQAARQREMDAIGAFGGMHTTGASQKLGAAGMAQQNQLAAMGMLPQLDALKYAGADRQMQIGQDYQDRLQTEQDAKIAAYNANQARPWEQLGRLNGIASGAGQLGGTQTGTSMSYGGGQKTPWYQQAAGVAGLLGKFL